MHDNIDMQEQDEHKCTITITTKSTIKKEISERQHTTTHLAKTLGWGGS